MKLKLQIHELLASSKTHAGPAGFLAYIEYVRAVNLIHQTSGFAELNIQRGLKLCCSGAMCHLV